jgi:hypothetical protein
VKTEVESIALAVQQKPEIVLLDREKFNDFYAHIVAEVESHEPDVTTDKGRKAIAALAFKVARTKTAIDESGKDLNSKLREQINLVDASRREIREKLDSLKETARRPLTEWEEREKAREEYCRQQIENLKASASVGFFDTSETATEQLAAVEAIALDPDRFGGFYAEAAAAKNATIDSLRAAIIRLKKQEDDAAELARFRAAEEARKAAELEAARIAREKRLAEQAAELKRYEEEARKKAEAARIEAAERAAEEKAKRAAEYAAQEAAFKLERERKKEADRIAREHAAALEKERLAKESAERKLREEADRIALAKAEAARKAAEEERLAANKKHRAAVMRTAKEALMERAGLSEAKAKAVVLAVVNEQVPGMTVRFS